LHRLTAATYLAVLMKGEIGDVNRFLFGESLCSYAGVVSSKYSSGKTVGHSSITKEGSTWLRWVMAEAAQNHVHKYDTAMTEAYLESLRGEERRSRLQLLLGGCCCVVIRC
jgi:transposase